MTVNGWSFNFGTSAAAPHVAGVAALVIGAHRGQMDPPSTPSCAQPQATSGAEELSRR
jgi:subtilisin family serine protease